MIVYLSTQPVFLPILQNALDPVLTNIPNDSAPSVEHLDFSDHALVLGGIVINDYNNKLSPKLKSKRLWRASTLANPVHWKRQ